MTKAESESGSQHSPRAGDQPCAHRPGISITAAEAVQQLVCELQVHQIELEMQGEDLRRTQLELEEAKNRYEDLFNLAPVGYLVLSDKGLILGANVKAAATLHLAQNSPIKKKFSSFIFTDDADIFYLQQRQCVASGEPKTCELRLVLPDDPIHWVRLDLLRLNCAECLLTFTDISDLKKREEELQTSRQKIAYAAEKWRQTFNSVPDPIAIISPEYSIVRTNQAFARFVGKNADELPGFNCYRLVHGADNPPDECPLAITLREHKENSAELFEARSGKHLKVITAPLFTAEGEFMGATHVIHDITQAKKIEEIYAGIQEELEAKVVERTAKLVEALKQTKKVTFELIWAEERERERIAGELHDRVGQSLLLAKMKLGRLISSLPAAIPPAHAEEIAELLATSLHDIRSLTFKTRPPVLDTADIDTALEWLCKSINEDYPLQIDFTPDGKPKPLSADVRYALYHGVRELLINVAKYAKTEKAQLATRVEGGELIVQVKDKGVGFDPHAVSESQDKKGGYGLYNVQQRMINIGGKCSVESAPASGTTVSLSVLLAEAESQEEQQ